jgi:hypothetical protein
LSIVSSRYWVIISGTCNGYLFGKRVFADVIKDFEMRGLHRWALNTISCKWEKEKV